MPDLTLDLHSESILKEVLDQRNARGFHLTEGSKLVLDPLRSAPEKSLIGTLKEKLPFIDFDAGGLKVFETNYRGSTIKFTAKPGWEFDARGGKSGLGSPTLTLEFSVRF